MAVTLSVLLHLKYFHQTRARRIGHPDKNVMQTLCCRTFFLYIKVPNIFNTMHIVFRDIINHKFQKKIISINSVNLI